MGRGHDGRLHRHAQSGNRPDGHADRLVPGEQPIRLEIRSDRLTEPAGAKLRVAQVGPDASVVCSGTDQPVPTVGALAEGGAGSGGVDHLERHAEFIGVFGLAHDLQSFGLIGRGFRRPGRRRAVAGTKEKQGQPEA